MILLPTRGRPRSLARFISACRLTGATLPVTVIVDEDDIHVYEEAWQQAPMGWTLFPNKDIRDLNAAANNVFKACPDEAFYGFMADDIVPETEGWDVNLRDACLAHHIAWGDDGIRQSGALDAPALCTHPFISGALARAWGWLLSPYTNRHCQDLIWRDFARTLGIGAFLPRVHTRHLHWQTGHAAYDATYAIQPSPREGDAQYRAYKDSERFHRDVARVRERLGL